MVAVSDILLEQHANLLRQGAVLVDPAGELPADAAARAHIERLALQEALPPAASSAGAGATCPTPIDREGHQKRI
jgi:hypothetical protein